MIVDEYFNFFPNSACLIWILMVLQSKESVKWFNCNIGRRGGGIGYLT